MKATIALLHAFGASLRIETVEIPPLRDGQILVRVEAAGICGSDVHMWQGKDPRTPLPMILGHEGVGRIVDIDGEKRDIHGQPLQPGDLIIWERGVTCGECYQCAVRKQPALCPHRWVYGIYRGYETPPHLNGCYASHIILDPRTQLIVLPEGSQPLRYVAASCSGATAAHALDMATPRIGDTVVIFGPGPLGAYATLLAKASGAEQIVLVGGTASRLEICHAMGATLLLNRHETTDLERQEAIQSITHGRGADIVIEASGSVAAAQEALDVVAQGGQLLLVGFGTPVSDMKLRPFEQVVRKNVSLRGVWVSDVGHTLQALSLVRQHPDLFDQLITHRYPLEEATRGLQSVTDRRAMKAVLLP